MTGRDPILRWREVFDGLEADLDRVTQAIEAGEEVPALTSTPPVDLDPPPQTMRARAEELALRLAEVQDAARRELDRLGGELAAVGRRRAAGSAYASHDGSA